MVRKLSLLATMDEGTKKGVRLQHAKEIKNNQYANYIKSILLKPPK